MQICGQTVDNFLKLPTYCYKPWFIVNRLKVIIVKLVEILHVLCKVIVYTTILFVLKDCCLRKNIRFIIISR